MTAPKIPPSALKIGESDYVVSGRFSSLCSASSLGLQHIGFTAYLKLNCSTLSHVNILDKNCRNLDVKLAIDINCGLHNSTSTTKNSPLAIWNPIWNLVAEISDPVWKYIG